ncbi:MAG: serine hydrolase [candidate division Zixibacteria bacterium]|nr:serine hydrolase [candidate division Zixibacteria bacterium]MBU1470971.1 serine hydrolase [candidate division Zixibacteria bacterium]MBU2625551.1 serine hydrolase [candidate division Zixibacteria bacterium]
MKRSRQIFFIGAATLIMLGCYHRFGYPLRNFFDASLCADAYLATVTMPLTDTYFQTERNVSRKPSVNCSAAIVIDNSTNEILYQKNADAVRSIASITKLLTAMVLIDLDLDWAEVVKVSREDASNSARSRLKIGETFYASDLFYIMLINSDNRAARTLARSTGLSNAEFVARMNQKAKSLGMYDTEIYEVTGLDQRNVSTAMDCARLIDAALKVKLIATAATTDRYSYRSLNHKRRRDIVNTNKLLSSGWSVLGGKTGYIQKSGYCFVTRLCDDNNHDITVAVLGAPGTNTRFRTARTLASWAFKNLNRFDQESHHAERGSD